MYYLQLLYYFLFIVLDAGQILNQSITFGPLDSEKAITFNIADDSIALEPPEKFTWLLTAVTISDGIMLQPNGVTDIFIFDEDGKCSHNLLENKYFIFCHPPLNFLNLYLDTLLA